MTLLFHQIAKDLRAERLGLAVWLVILANGCAFTALKADRLFSDSVGTTFVFLSGTLFVAQLVFAWLLATRFVHADAPTGTSAFWLTRPLSAGSLLASKLALLLVLFVGLPALSAATAAWSNGVSPSLLPRMALENAVVSALLLLPIVAVATITQTVADTFYVSIVAAGTWIVLHFGILYGLPALASRPVSTAGSARASGFAVAIGVALIGSLGAIVHQYLTRSRRRTIAMAAGTALVALAAADAWPWSFWDPTHFQPKAVEAPRFSRDALQVTLDKPTVGRPGEAGRVFAPFRLEVSGAPAGWAMHPYRLRGALEDPNGHVPPIAIDLESGAVGLSRGSYPTLVMNEIGRALGDRILRPYTAFWQPGYLGLMLSDQEYRPWIGVPGRIAAEVAMSAYRVAIGPTIPLVAGSIGTVDDRQTTVVHVARSPEAWVIDLRESQPLLMFQVVPDVYPVLRNRTLKEAAVLPRAMWRSFVAQLPGAGGLLVTRTWLVAGTPGSGTVPELSDAWMADAELVLVSVRWMGTVTTQVRDDHYVLPPF